MKMDFSFLNVLTVDLANRVDITSTARWRRLSISRLLCFFFSPSFFRSLTTTSQTNAFHYSPAIDMMNHIPMGGDKKIENLPSLRTYRIVSPHPAK